MHLHGKPTAAAAPDEGGYILAGLLLMDAQRDVTYTTGYYWMLSSPGQDHDDTEAWRSAMFEGHGPFHSAAEALEAASTTTPESMDLAWRLTEGASLMRTGHLEPTMTQLLEYLERALSINEKRRDRPDGAGRTAHGLFVADGFKATADAKAQFEALGDDDENDAAKLFEGVDTSTDGEPPESDAEHEKELDAALAAAFGGEDKYHAALARLQEAAEEAPDVEIPPERPAADQPPE